MKRVTASVALLSLLVSACTSAPGPDAGSGSTVSSASSKASGILPVAEAGAFGASVTYTEPTVAINAGIAAPFQNSEATNLADLEKAYGINLSAAEKAFLEKNKFVEKTLTDTSITPLLPKGGNADMYREFVGLYNTVNGEWDYKTRGAQNAVFYTSDVFFNAYNNLFVELLKEMENKVFFPAMKDLSIGFYNASVEKLKAATTDADKKTWTQVRNYYAVPYAVFSASAEPLNQDSYFKDGEMLDPATVQADFKKNDATVDTFEKATAIVKTLKLDSASEAVVIKDLKQVYAAAAPGVPYILENEFAEYKKQTDVDFKIDFSFFTPRGSYTSSSLRRAYFRGMNWYIQVPFFVKSPQLTADAFAITHLMAEHPEHLNNYNKLEATINFLVGRSDDLMPADYLSALHASKNAADPEAASLDYLMKARSPLIKSLSAMYSAVGVNKTDDVVNLTKGMRFFSGKFIIDSFWTGQLSQGDEAIKPGYDQKLPPYVSSLEVMAILGSDYAKSQIPKLDFYKPTNAKAIDKAVADLTAAQEKLDVPFWQSNIYNGWLWTIKGLFSWQKEHKSSLPLFMQSPMWDIKTLMTGAGFWAELRHATILYAKQSFAELGGGGGDCDTRPVPPAPKSYIEPQPLAYERLHFLAKRTAEGLRSMKFELSNLNNLDSFVQLMEKVQSYTKKQLGNTALNETIVDKTYPDVKDETGKVCVQHEIEGESDWEDLRIGIVSGLEASLPLPVEGPVLPAKDRRAAIVADIHTGQDSDNPLQIVYQATGVPRVIIVAVKDVNGPRYTIGFTYSHYEFRKDHGGNRMTDEDWQKNFYIGEDPNAAFNYTNKSGWPQMNSWYLPITDIK